MSEVDPDPYEPGEGQGASVLGGSAVPEGGDPTDGGKRGEIGEAPSIRADQPSDGTSYPVAGGDVREESDAVPDAAPGPDA